MCTPGSSGQHFWCIVPTWFSIPESDNAFELSSQRHRKSFPADLSEGSLGITAEWTTGVADEEAGGVPVAFCPRSAWYSRPVQNGRGSWDEHAVAMDFADLFRYHVTADVRSTVHVWQHACPPGLRHFLTKYRRMVLDVWACQSTRSSVVFLYSAVRIGSACQPISSASVSRWTASRGIIRPRFLQGAQPWSTSLLISVESLKVAASSIGSASSWIPAQRSTRIVRGDAVRHLQ